MLSCKEVATLASDYLDHNTKGSLHWKLRLHLMMCSHCRRFIRHLRITRTIASQMAKSEPPEIDSKLIYQRVLHRVKPDG